MRFISTGILLLYACLLQAQNNFVSAANDCVYSDGTLSFSLGQLFFQTRNIDSFSICEGNQQPHITKKNGAELLSIPMVHIYPNPFIDDIMLEIPEVIGPDLNYKIYDACGVMIQKGQILSQVCSISAATFPSGIYILFLSQNDAHNASYKLIKL